MGEVRLEHVTKRYGDVTAVADMNLEIRDGEFVCLVGPSGCGKSTTLEAVAGLTYPTEGTVSIAGRDVTDLPPKDRGIAMVFQNIALFPHMDVYDNVSFGLRLRDYDDEEVERRVERAAEIVQLQGMLDRMPDEMSGGQRQRVAIARAIVRQPEVFLMDEPLANLDAKLRVHMRTELQRLHRELETTIVYVTHDQAEAMTMSDRIAVMNDGDLQQLAPPLECYNAPANRFVAGFIGSPSMNLTPGTLTEGGFESEHLATSFDPGAVGLSAGDRVRIDPDGLHAPTGDYSLDRSDLALVEEAKREADTAADEVTVGDVSDQHRDGGGDDPADGPRWELSATVMEDGSLEGEGGDPLEIDVAGYLVEPGDDVELGVRPEDVYPAPSAGDAADPTEPLSVTADVLEPMGDEIFVYLRLSGGGDLEMGERGASDDQLMMSVPPDSDIEEDDDLAVVLDRAKVHLFDGPTGTAVAHGVEPVGTGTSGAGGEEPTAAEE